MAGYTELIDKNAVFAAFPVMAVIAGKYTGVECIDKFGHNGAVGATKETLWGNTVTELMVRRTVAIVHKVSSGSADDDVAGTGALTVQLEGLDASYDYQTEIIILTGQTAVNSTYEYIRMFRMTVLTTGAGGENAGILYAGTGAVAGGVPAVVDCLIEAGQNQSLVSYYPIKAGYTGYVFDVLFESAVAKAITATLVTSAVEDGPLQVKQIFDFTIGQVRHVAVTQVNEKCDIEMRALAVGAGGNISGKFSVLLVPNVT